MVDRLFESFTFFVIQIILCIFGYMSDSVVYFKIAAALILCFCIINGKRQKYIINPYYLFILTPISLLIYYNISDSFLVDLTSNTWLLIISNINALLIGLHYTSKTKFRERILGRTNAKKLYTKLAITFVVLGVIPQFIYGLTRVTIPLAYIISMLSTVGVIAAMATKDKKLCFVTIAIYISPLALGGASKTGVLTLLLALIIAVEKFYLNRSSAAAYAKARRRIILGCILAIPVMIFAFTFANKDRGRYDADEGYEYYSSRVEWNYGTAYFMPYMYIVTPWANLQYVTETQDDRSNGYWFTKPILGVVFGDYYLKDEYVPVSYSSFNTFSFIGLHFKDFGYWGSLFASLFLGFFIKKVYSLYIESPSPLDAGAYVFTAQATLELFFSNHFFGQSYPFMIVIVMYILKKMLRI